MYSVLLVEDESSVREIIRQRTPWETYGFTIAGEVGNGLEALEHMEEQLPDVVITDIKMPFMDGIALTESIHRLYPSVTIVILSGFDEFSYAQSAIRYNVTEYVLKPVSSEDIAQLLIRIKAHLDAEIVKRKDVAALRETFQEVLPLLKEKFLLSLLIPSHPVGNEWLITRSKLYGIHLEGNAFVVAVFETNRQDVAVSNPAEDDDALQGIAMARIVEESLEATKERAASVVFGNQIAIIFAGTLQNEHNGERMMMKQVLRELRHINTFLEKYLDANVTIGVGAPVYGMNKIAESYSQAMDSLNFSRFVPDQNILFINDVNPSRFIKNAGAPHIDERLRADLATAVRVGTDGEILSVTHEMFNELAGINPTTEGIQMFLLEILGFLSEIAASYGMTLGQVRHTDREINLFAELQTINSLGKASRWITGFSCKLREALSGARKNSHIQFVEEAKRQIYQRYAQQEFGLDTLCDHLGVSPSYFSSTFKREIGQSFVQYLTMVRMERAKELLRNTDMKTYEIAEAIGLSESNYFSFCFKRYEGCSPSQYRQKARPA